MLCAACGSKATLTTAQMQTVFRDEHLAITGIEHYTCAECGEDTLTAEQGKIYDRAVIAAYATKRGMLSPDEIKALRKTLGFTQRQFEELLGVHTPTCSRWENGTASQSETADRLMRIIREFPNTGAWLRAHLSQ